MYLMQYHFYMVLIKGVKLCYFIFQDGTENLNDIYIYKHNLFYFFRDTIFFSAEPVVF